MFTVNFPEQNQFQMSANPSRRFKINIKLLIKIPLIAVGIFIFLIVSKSADAAGYGWTGVASTSTDCSSTGLAKVMVETRDRTAEDPIVDAGNITLTIKKQLDNSEVASAPVVPLKTLITSCIFNPNQHYVYLEVAGNASYRPTQTQFKMNNPGSFVDKSIILHAHVQSVSDVAAVDHSLPASGQWLNYNPEFRVIG